MIIHRLKASGFQIIGDPVTLEFPEEGKIGILGQNESGKTTLLEVIEYALYGVRRGRTAEESRENIVTWGKEEARLEIEFTSGQDRFLLRRTLDARGAHKASLTPVVNGEEASSKTLNNLTEIEIKIGQITGMDRDSFTKLIYIRQKDLDALKELAKARREQLVNKVMGIEVFDDATAKAKSGLSTVERDLEKERVELETVRKNAQAYEQRLSQKNMFQIEITDSKRKLQEREIELKEAESILEGFDWLSTFNSTRRLIASINEQRSRIQQDGNTLQELQGQLQKYQELLDKHEPVATRLERLRASFSTLENRLEQARNTLNSLKERESEAITRAGLTDKDRRELSQDLPAKKQRQLALFALSLVLCVTTIVVSIFLRQFIITPLAVLFSVMATKFYLTYQKIDRILGSSAEIMTLQRQIADATENLGRVQTEMDSHVAETNIKNLKEIDLALFGINQEIKLATGQESIEAIEALRENGLRTLKKLEELNPDVRLAELNRQLTEREKEIRRLQETMPTSADGLQYDMIKHQETKRRVETLRREYGEFHGELQRKIGTLNQIEKDLERLIEDFNRHPTLEEQYKILEQKSKTLGLVVNELGETSRELRGKVIPHASFIINQILPTLTDGRYSQFEITEDLKFKAYSSEAGGYKEREVFSGGTQDQFLIALRLAFTQSILDSRVMADRYSLLMDECISSSDDQRKQGIFEVLDLMKKTFTQIFIIAHEDVSNFVDHHIILARNQRGYTEIRSKSW